MSKLSDLKFVPCEKCGGPPNVVGGPLPRSIFYFTDRIEIRCNNAQCGEMLVIRKSTEMKPQVEAILCEAVQ